MAGPLGNITSKWPDLQQGAIMVCVLRERRPRLDVLCRLMALGGLSKLTQNGVYIRTYRGEKPWLTIFKFHVPFKMRAR